MKGFYKHKSISAAGAALMLLLCVTLPLFTPTRQDFLAADATLTNQTCPQKVIALTFDDGPRRATTSLLLDGLAERGVPATFFVIGSLLEGNEDLLRRMDAQGHQIGIHTYDHVKLIGLSPADFAAQVSRTRTLLSDILGHNGFLVRPPYGMVDDGVRAHAEAPIILWSVDPEDWQNRNTAREVAFITEHVKDGSIILMHDIFYESVDAALQVVDELHRQGYLFVTIDQLFSLRSRTLTPGKVYWNGYP